MTPEQRDLARHALGLGNGRKKSYRNRFVVWTGGDDFQHWMALVAAGDAWHKSYSFGVGYTLFHLTQQGALKALDAGETLDPEDFPDGGKP